VVGYPLFWLLRSESHVPEISQRFQVGALVVYVSLTLTHTLSQCVIHPITRVAYAQLLTESYVRGCGRVYRQTLFDQVRACSCARVCAYAVHSTHTPTTQVRLLDEFTAIATKLTQTPADDRPRFLRTRLAVFEVWNVCKFEHACAG
jgi:hypothetical protein